MMPAARLPWDRRQVLTALTAAGVLLLAFVLGWLASITWIILLIAAPAALALFRRPVLGLLALVLAALVAPVELGTGTEVTLNAATLFVPALAGVWLLSLIARGRLELTPGRVNRPLLLFLVAGLLSLLIGIATWDPTVPRKASFTLVQLAQWAIFAFAALAFWLGANLPRSEKDLRRLVIGFLIVGLSVALLRVAGLPDSVVSRVATFASVRAPFWSLLAGLSAAFLLFDASLSRRWRLLALAGLVTSLYYVFRVDQEALSNWAGVVTALGVLIWLRFPRLRWPIVIIVLLLASVGVLFPAVYDFAGGEDEWNLSGQSRIVLIERVVEATMRNPITGLGPAAYRPYTELEPLAYGQAYWLQPKVNSHNNYVDLFSHVGILGLALFAWFVTEMTVLGRRLHRRYTRGFRAAYINAMLAIGSAALVQMLLADWILPFVYNIGFQGFQASMLVWLFLGGLVAIDNMAAVVG